MAMADIGLIGLAVMGQNLVLNMADGGYTVAVHNRSATKSAEFLDGPARGYRNIIGARSIAALAEGLKRPRRILLMVRAGEVVDRLIEGILPLLEKGDIIIDGGNSHFADTARRAENLAGRGIRFVGAGVSGGEEGARRGPSIMPGGDREAWPHIKSILRDISAKTDGGDACCNWVGSGGAGHYVKMVHNGIEYGDMQIIAEAYQLLHEGLGLDYDNLHEVFAGYCDGPLDSYLIEITRDILAFRDEGGEPLVEKILDAAGQKGTGKWTGISALELGVPVTLIGEAVFARCLSGLKDERSAASKKINLPKKAFDGDGAKFVEDIEQALLFAKIISYAQGFMLMGAAAKEHGWELNYGEIALMWRGGCVIRSVLLEKIKKAFDGNPTLPSLLMDDYFGGVLVGAHLSARKVVSSAVAMGIPVPSLSAALAFFDGYRSARLPANLLQAMRDYFGAHTYERTDRPRGEFFHTNWTGTGGAVPATGYEV